jgi:hypothetical protein
VFGETGLPEHRNEHQALPRQGLSMPSDVVEEPPSEWSVFGETGLHLQNALN